MHFLASQTLRVAPWQCTARQKWGGRDADRAVPDAAGGILCAGGYGLAAHHAAGVGDRRAAALPLHHVGADATLWAGPCGRQMNHSNQVFGCLAGSCRRGACSAGRRRNGPLVLVPLRQPKPPPGLVQP